MKGAYWTPITILGGPYLIFQKNRFLTGNLTSTKPVLATFECRLSAAPLERR